MFLIAPKEIPLEAGCSVVLVVEPATRRERDLLASVRTTPEWREVGFQVWRCAYWEKGRVWVTAAALPTAPSLEAVAQGFREFPEGWVEILRSAKTS